MAKFACSPKCWPLYIYVALLVISLATTAFGPDYVDEHKDGVVIRKKINKPRVLVTTAVWGTLWSYLLYYLCGKCHEGWAWVVLFLPLVVFTGLVILLGLSAYIVHKDNKEHGTVPDGDVAIDRNCALQAEHHCAPDMSSGPGTCYSKAYAVCMAMKK